MMLLVSFILKSVCTCWSSVRKGFEPTFSGDSASMQVLKYFFAFRSAALIETPASDHTGIIQIECQR